MPQKTEGVTRKPEGMGGLAKGLAIVEAFSAHSVMSVADAARAAGATRASARRCLITLTELGYLERSGREFRPLTRLRRLGGLASRRDQLALLAQPLLARARDELAESVSLAVLDNDTSLFIARAEAEHIVSTGVRVGARLPVYCSATGRVLLSQFSDKDILARIGRKPLARRTPHTLTTPSELLTEIRSVRERRYAVSDEELELGLRALAVPVMGANDEIIAAVSVSAASARVRGADLRRRFVPVLQSCARLLAEAVGEAG
jgi:IclR family transcriptional regulator, pca regulon regulatory protein